MIIQGYSNVQIYQAQARLLIEDERSTAVPGLQNEQNTYYEDPEPYYQTQYKILKGRDLTRRVVRKLHLETVPEFNGTKPAPPTPLSMLRDLKTRLIGLRHEAEPAAGAGAAARSTRPPTSRRMVGAFLGRVERRPGPRQPPGGRHVHLRGSEVRRRRGEHADRRVRRPRTSRSSCGRRRACSTGSTTSWRPSRSGSRRASGRSPSTARRRTRCRSTTSRTSCSSRLNQLNDTATRARSSARAEGIALQPGQGDRQRHEPGRDSDHRDRTRACRPRKSKLGDLQRAEGPAARALRATSTRRCSTSTRSCRTRSSSSTSRSPARSSRSATSTRRRVIEEQTFAKNLEGAKSEATDLNRKGIGYGVMEREAKSNREVYQSLLHAREGAARLGQQPHEQRARRRSRRGAARRRSRRAAAARG